MNDNEKLIKGLKNNDKEVFEEIYRLYYIPLCYYCAAYVGRVEDAEEIVQSLFLRLWIKRSKIKIDTSLKSYLYRAIQNDSYNYLNRKKIEGKFMLHKERMNGSPFESVQHTIEKDELEGLIKQAILKLPLKRRRIFEMSRFQGLKYSEIADKLSVSVKTVETQMGKALKMMRKALKDYLP